MRRGAQRGRKSEGEEGKTMLGDRERELEAMGIIGLVESMHHSVSRVK